MAVPRTAASAARVVCATAGGAERAGIARRCAVVAIDFDETLTVSDTCGVLGSLGARAAAPGVGDARWRGLVERFGEDYAAVVPGLLPAPPLSQWRLERFQQYVAELQGFDVMCNARLEGGALAGISAEELQRAASEHVAPQPGAAAVLQQLLAECSCPGEVRVLSASWSDQFVRAALRHHFAVSLPEVTANRLVTAADGVSTGAVEWNVATAGDKAEWVRRWPSMDPERETDRQTETERHRDTETDSAFDASKPPVYHSDLKVVVGDSIGDLPAMVEAGIGVIVKQSKSLRDAIAAFGLTLHPLGQLLADDSGRLDGLISSAAAGSLQGNWLDWCLPII